MKKKQIKFLIILLCIVIFAFLAMSRKIKVVSYEIGSEKVEKPLKIAFIADLHSCNYGKNQEKLHSKIKEAKPDLVLLGGDIVDDVLPQDNAKITLKFLGENYKTYYVSGNHEYWSYEIDSIKEMISSHNIEILEGEVFTEIVNGQVINICGIDDPDGGEENMQKQLAKVGERADFSDFTLLLSHRPERIYEYVKYPFDLVLSGHAHGGQWRIPYLLNGFLAPNQGFFPKFAGGYYEVNGVDFIVSRGLAKESTRVPRIFNRPELVIVEIK